MKFHRDPAARSWGSGPRALGLLRISLLAATVLGLVAACSTTGGAAGTSGAPLTPPFSTAPSPSSPSTTAGASPAASPSPGPASQTPSVGEVETAVEALAAVIAEHPEFADHELLYSRAADGSPGPIIGPPVMGRASWAVVSAADDGFEVTFVTGSGDCPSGCIEHRFDVYLVGVDGAVSLRCSAGPGPAALPPGGGLPPDPCRPDGT